MPRNVTLEQSSVQVELKLEDSLGASAARHGYPMPQSEADIVNDTGEDPYDTGEDPYDTGEDPYDTGEDPYDDVWEDVNLGRFSADDPSR